MACLKKYFYKIIFLFILSFSFVSCGSLNYFTPSSENLADNDTDQMKLSQIESELLEIKQSHSNLKLQMDDKNTATQNLRDKVLRLEKKISILEKKNTVIKPVQYKIEYTNPQVLYKKARNLLIEENYVNAATLFSEFIKNHPQNSLADNAVYWLGECHYSLGDYKKAILVFKNLETRYPKSEKVPDAILKLGYSYLSLDDSNRAHHYLKKILKEYPFSPAAEKAQEKLGDFE